MSLHDDLLKHQIFVQRLIGTEVENIGQFLNLLRKRAIIEVGKGSVGAALKNSLRGSMRGLTDASISNMTDIATYESEFSAKIFARALDVSVDAVSAIDLERALRTNNMAINYLEGGKTALKKSLATAYNQFSQRKADDITQVIKDSKLLKRTEAETITAIHERVDGLLTTQSKSLAQTAIIYTTALARSETILANPNVTNKVLWVADLEVNEHCSECEELDGNVYDISDIEEPPLHWGCACHLEPVEGDGNE